jgi:hypothetical protein
MNLLRKYYDTGIYYGSLGATVPGAIEIAGADQGLSIEGNMVVLGQASSVFPATPALLSGTRVIPFDQTQDSPLIFDLGARVGNQITIVGSHVIFAGGSGSASDVTFSAVNQIAPNGGVGLENYAFAAQSNITYTNPAATGEVGSFSSTDTFLATTGATEHVDYLARSIANQSGGSGGMTCFKASPGISQSGTTTGVTRGFWYTPTVDTLVGKNIAVQTDTGIVYINTGNNPAAQGGLVIGFPATTVPGARLMINGGTTADVPMQIFPGTLKTASVLGGIEVSTAAGSALYYTNQAQRGIVFVGLSGAGAPATNTVVLPTLVFGSGAALLSTPTDWANVRLNTGTGATTNFKIPLYT